MNSLSLGVEFLTLQHSRLNQALSAYALMASMANMNMIISSGMRRYIIMLLAVVFPVRVTDAVGVCNANENRDSYHHELGEFLCRRISRQVGPGEHDEDGGGAHAELDGVLVGHGVTLFSVLIRVVIEMQFLSK